MSYDEKQKDTSACIQNLVVSSIIVAMMIVGLEQPVATFNEYRN